MSQAPGAREEVGRPGLDPGTLGSEERSGPFRCHPAFADSGSDLHCCFHGLPLFAGVHRDSWSRCRRRRRFQDAPAENVGRRSSRFLGTAKRRVVGVVPMAARYRMWFRRVTMLTLRGPPSTGKGGIGGLADPAAAVATSRLGPRSPSTACPASCGLPAADPGPSSLSASSGTPSPRSRSSSTPPP